MPYPYISPKAGYDQRTYQCFRTLQTANSQLASILNCIETNEYEIIAGKITGHDPERNRDVSANIHDIEQLLDSSIVTFHTEKTKMSAAVRSRFAKRKCMFKEFLEAKRALLIRAFEKFENKKVELVTV